MIIFWLDMASLGLHFMGATDTLTNFTHHDRSLYGSRLVWHKHSALALENRRT